MRTTPVEQFQNQQTTTLATFQMKEKTSTSKLTSNNCKKFIYWAKLAAKSNLLAFKGNLQQEKILKSSLKKSEKVLTFNEKLSKKTLSPKGLPNEHLKLKSYKSSKNYKIDQLEKFNFLSKKST